MKTKILFLAIITSSLFWLLSCDYIDEPFLKDTVAGDTTGIDTVSFSSAVQTTRGVLLEEFTGHKCPNCPAASVIAHDLTIANPGKVAVVSVHAGVFATTDATGDFTYEFRTTEGTDLDAYFKVADYGYPNGLISRRKYNPTRWIWAPQYWTNQVDSLVALPSIASIAVNAYFVNGNTIKAYIRTQFLGANNNQYKLCVLITEDSIVKPQKNNNPAVGTVPIITDYVHRGVYRGSINGQWGADINSGPVANLQTFLSGYSVTVGADWIPAHCNVVAYLYDKVTLEVFQVAEKVVK